MFGVIVLGVWGHCVGCLGSLCWVLGQYGCRYFGLLWFVSMLGLCGWYAFGIIVVGKRFGLVGVLDNCGLSVCWVIVVGQSVLSSCLVSVWGHCGWSMFWVNVVGQCFGSVWLVSVLGHCGWSVFWVSVVGQCFGSLWMVGVLGQCGWSVFWVVVVGQCLGSLWMVGVLGQCGWSVFWVRCALRVVSEVCPVLTDDVKKDGRVLPLSPHPSSRPSLV